MEKEANTEVTKEIPEPRTGVHGKMNIDVAGSISDLQNAVKEIQLKKRLYKTLFRGKGLDFDGYRQFNQDDDASFIDWKASKRAHKLLAKQYIEEQNRKIMFLVDTGDNMVFGSTPKLKCEYAAEVALSLAYLMLISGDKIGFLAFNDKIANSADPIAGLKQFYFFVDVLSNPANYEGNSDLGEALNSLVKYSAKSLNAVVIISDFLRMSKIHESILKIVGDEFETIAIMVKDPLDKALPENTGEVVIEDTSRGQQLIIDSKVARAQYERYSAEQEKVVRDMLGSAGIDILSLSTKDSFILSLAEFLKERTKRGGLI